MKKNMGLIDRLVRIIIAAVIAYLYFKGSITGFWAVILLIVAVVFSLTAIIGSCPLYNVFGIKTCKKN